MGKPVSYLQTDARWKGLDYSAKGEKTTIGASGCGPTSMAMVLATWADRAVTPVTECAWALKNGYKCPHSGTYYGYFVPAGQRFGLAVTRLNTASIYGNSTHAAHRKAKAALDAGNLVIACMGKGNWTSSGHYVLCWKVDRGKIYINDPASTLARRTQGDYGLFVSQVKFYWVVDRPAAKKEESAMPEKEVRALIEEMQGAFEQKYAEANSTIKRLEAEIAALEKAVEAQKPVVYDTLDEIREEQPWAYEVISDKVARGVVQGDQHGRLQLSISDLRQLVIAEREKQS